MRGSLILLIQRAYNAIADDLPKGFLLPEGQIQASTIGLPGRVLREALVNAFIHRSFKVNQPIQIIRYGNRIEIKNPGYSLKPEDQLGDPGSNQRNPFVAAIFHETNLAETKGSGIRTMRKLMQQAGMVAPTFESDHQENQFSARLLLHHFLSEIDIRWLNSFSGISLNDHQKQALVFVKEVGAIDNATYRQLSGADILKASTDLRALRDVNLLTANGKSRMTYYTPGPNLLTLQDKEETLQDKEETLQDKEETLQDKEETLQDKEEKEVLLESLPKEIRNLLTHLGKRSGGRQDIEQLILQICKVRPFTVKELSALIGRHVKHLQVSYLKPLIVKGELKYTIQDMPNHPDQAYITSQE